MNKADPILNVMLPRSKSAEFVVPEGFRVSYSNPALFSNVIAWDDFVYAPFHAKIEEAYKKAGKGIYRPDEAKAEVVEDEPVQEVVREEVVEEDFAPEVSDVKHWSELSWPKMRSKAKEFTDEPIKSKEQAEEVLLKAEVEGKI